MRIAIPLTGVGFFRGETRTFYATSFYEQYPDLVRMTDHVGSQFDYHLSDGLPGSWRHSPNNFYISQEVCGQLKKLREALVAKGRLSL